MKIAISKEDLNLKDNKVDIGNIPRKTLEYIMKKATASTERYTKLYNYYIGKHDILNNDNANDDLSVNVVANYAKMIVDIIQGYYLGEPIKYDHNDVNEDLVQSGVQAKVKKGQVVRVKNNKAEDGAELGKEVDIRPLIDCYDAQAITEIDNELGKDLGIYGESYELCYASSDEEPLPKSAVIHPQNCILVTDNTVEEKPLFAIVWDENEDLSNKKYYSVDVYGLDTISSYKSEDLENFIFHKVKDSDREHYFGDIPVIPYKNNDELQGDFEQQKSLIDAVNELLSDRLTDKKKFVKSLLAVYGATIEDVKTLRDERYLDGIPTDARIEYIQKVFDEGSMDILYRTLVKEIHKQSLTVDMSDESFAGNSSGQAIRLKLLSMNMLVKNKIRHFEFGLKQRFKLYNNWLVTAKKMDFVSVTDVDPIFTVQLPIDESGIVDTVVKLQGIVDDSTLLSLLWFVKDPQETLEAVKKQKQEAQEEYMNAFKAQNGLTDNLPNEDDSEPTEGNSEQNTELVE